MVEKLLLTSSSITDFVRFSNELLGVSDTILKTNISSLHENAEATSQNPKASISYRAGFLYSNSAFVTDNKDVCSIILESLKPGKNVLQCS